MRSRTGSAAFWEREKNPLDQDHSIRTEASVLRNDRLDSHGNLLDRVAVICSDHEENELGVDPIHLPLGETPEHVLGPVAGNSEIKGTELGIAILPDLAAASLPPVCDGVTVKDQLDVASNLGRIVVVILDADEPFQPGKRGARGICRRL